MPVQRGHDGGNAGSRCSHAGVTGTVNTSTAAFAFLIRAEVPGDALPLMAICILLCTKLNPSVCNKSTLLPWLPLGHSPEVTP